MAAICPSLTYTPPASSSARRSRTPTGSSASRRGAPADRDGPEALLAGEAEELAVAEQHRDPRPRRAERAGRDDQAGPLAGGQRARPGQQVEGHGDRHRGGDADGQRVEREPVGAPVPVGEARARAEADGPAEEPGEQRTAPPAADAEEPQRHDVVDHRRWPAPRTIDARRRPERRGERVGRSSSPPGQGGAPTPQSAQAVRVADRRRPASAGAGRRARVSASKSSAAVARGRRTRTGR